MKPYANFERETLTRLFRPGTGDQPPYLAGREEEKQTCHRLMNNLLLQRRNPPGHIICYGPRGNGKTTLLRFLQKECKGSNTSTLWLDGSDIQSKTNFLQQIFDQSKELQATQNQHPEIISTAKNFLKNRAIKIALTKSATIHFNPKQAQEPEPASLKTILKAGMKEEKESIYHPLMLFIDEAHRLNIELGNELLNTSQSLINQDNIPFLLVLAGTPELENRLNHISTTFWNRSEQIRLGRISKQATQEAITRPLQKHGIDIKDDALQIVTEQAQGYPYFTQIWGEALCLQLQHNQDTTITTAHVTPAQSYFTKQKGLYYRNRYQEIQERNLLPLAESAAQIMLQQNKPIAKRRLEQKLQDHTGQDLKTVQEGIQTLEKLGYIWIQDIDSEYEPGIPSLMAHVLEQQKKTMTQELEETIKEALEENPYTPDSIEKTVAQGIIQARGKERPNPHLILQLQFLRHQYECLNPQEQDQEMNQYLSCKAKQRTQGNRLRTEIQTIQENQREQIQKEAELLRKQEMTEHNPCPGGPPGIHHT